MPRLLGSLEYKNGSMATVITVAIIILIIVVLYSLQQFRFIEAFVIGISDHAQHLLDAFRPRPASARRSLFTPNRRAVIILVLCSFQSPSLNKRTATRSPSSSTTSNSPNREKRTTMPYGFALRNLLEQHSLNEARRLEQLLEAFSLADRPCLVSAMAGLQPEMRIEVLEERLRQSRWQEQHGNEDDEDQQQYKEEERAPSGGRGRYRRPRPHHASAGWSWPGVRHVLLAVVALVVLPKAGQWALTATPGPVYVPPTYTHGTVLNETLRRGEAAMAARLGPLSDKPYRTSRVSGLINVLIDDVYKVRLNYSAVFPYFTTNTVADAHRDVMRQVEHDLVWRGRDAMYLLDRQLSNALEFSADRVNSSMIAVANAMGVPAADYVARYTQPPGRVQRMLQHWVPEAAEQQDPELVRDRMLWELVCRCQTYLLSVNARLIKRIDEAKAVLGGPQKRLEPVTDVLQAEVDRRRKQHVKKGATLVNAYEAEVKKWKGWRPSQWRNSTFVPLWMAGVLLRGERAPEWPYWDMDLAAQSVAELEDITARIVMTRATLDSLHGYFAAAQNNIAQSNDDRAKQHRSITPYSCAAVDSHLATMASDSDSEPRTVYRTPLDMLLFLDHTVQTLVNETRKWDAEDIHGAFEQARRNTTDNK